MIARKSDCLRAQEVLDAISETNERIKAFGITEDQFLHANDVRTRALADSLLMCALRVTEEAGKLSERSQRLGTSDDFPDHAPALRRMAPLLAILPNGLPS